MRKYELVLIIDPRQAEADSTALVAHVEQLLGSGLIQKDDLGVMPSAYHFGGNKGNTHIRIISYYCSLQPSAVKELKQALYYIKGMMRYFVYSMTDTQPFIIFKDVQKTLEPELTKKIGEVQRKSDSSKDRMNRRNRGQQTPVVVSLENAGDTPTETAVTTETTDEITVA